MGGGIITRSGRIVSPDEGVPTIADMAYALANVPRFGGYCRQPWTVAQHSCVVAEIIAMRGWDESVQLAALLHDAHEALTGDVPTPFKTPDMKDLQDKLDERIMDEYFPGGIAAYRELAAPIHDADRAALLAEAYIVGPERVDSSTDVVRYFGDPPSLADSAAVRRILRRDKPAVWWMFEFGRLSMKLEETA